jgi:hypothetical protein
MLRIYIWAINASRSLMEEQCDRLLKTADVHNVQVELLGIGHEFVTHSQRMEILRDALEEMTEQERNSTIVVAIDGSDTLFNGSSDVIIERFTQMNTRIVISAEKVHSYQATVYKERYDKIVTPYPYRYVNAGTFMGYGDSLLSLMNDMIQLKLTLWPHSNDQGLLGVWTYLHLKQQPLVRMDLNCDIFWVTCNDWDNLEIASSGEGKHIVNKTTGTIPPIIHLTCLGSPRVANVYQNAYDFIMSSRHCPLPGG